MLICRTNVQKLTRTQKTLFKTIQLSRYWLLSPQRVITMSIITVVINNVNNFFEKILKNFDFFTKFRGFWQIPFKPTRVFAVFDIKKDVLNTKSLVYNILKMLFCVLKFTNEI